MTPIKRIDPKVGLEGYCCSPKPWIFVTHWNGKKSTPHFEPDDVCEGCKLQLPKRARGYILVVTMGYAQKFFVELTPLALEQIERQVKEASMRGWFVEVKRERPVYNAPMTARLSQLDRPKPDLPPDEDPVPTLSVLWGMNGEIA